MTGTTNGVSPAGSTPGGDRRVQKASDNAGRAFDDALSAVNQTSPEQRGAQGSRSERARASGGEPQADSGDEGRARQNGDGGGERISRSGISPMAGAMPADAAAIQRGKSGDAATETGSGRTSHGRDADSAANPGSKVPADAGKGAAGGHFTVREGRAQPVDWSAILERLDDGKGLDERGRKTVERLLDRLDVSAKELAELADGESTTQNAEDVETANLDAMLRSFESSGQANSVSTGHSPIEGLRNLAAALSLASPVDRRAPDTGRPAGADVASAQQMPVDEAADDLFHSVRGEWKLEGAPGLTSGERLRAALASLSQDGTAQRDGAEAVRPEFTIVETRKFLGVATGQTAVASIVNAVSENEQWSSMLREAAATAATTLNAAKNASNSLKIQLSPAELGTVTATLKMSGGNLSIELRVETIEAYRQLSTDQNGLVRALRGHGYDIDQVVLHPPSATERGAAGLQASAGHTPAGAGQQNGQGAAPNDGGAQAGSGQQRNGGDSRGHDNTNGEGRRDQDETGRDHRGSGGGVYL